MNTKTIIARLVKIKNNKEITFVEPFYISSDSKTIMGEVSSREILFLEYRYTEAGSNPREFYGLKYTNEEIFKSLLRPNFNLFSFLHSGIIISFNSDEIPQGRKNSITYSDCCLTNGNQTRFLILYITLIKIYFKDNAISEIKGKELKKFKKSILDVFKKSEDITEFLENINLKKANDIVKFLLSNRKYYDEFKQLSLEDFLNNRIRATLNFVNAIVKDKEDINESEAGTLIAEANNATEIVNKQDLFGNKYQPQLEKLIFNEFIHQYPNIQIEYRAGEITDNEGNKIHLLFLLRPIIALGLLTKEKDIFTLTNRRDSTYRILEKFMGKIDTKQELTSIISRIIPQLYRIRIDIVEPLLNEIKEKFIREYKKKAYADDIFLGTFEKEFNEAVDDKAKERVIKNLVKYSTDHLMGVIVFTIRKMFVEKSDKNITLTIPENKERDFFSSLLEQTYRKYINSRIKEQYFSSFVRTKEFFEIGQDSYSALRSLYKFDETELIDSNRSPIT